MIYRVVRLHIRHAETAALEALVQELKPHIEAFEGCYQVELLRDTQVPEVYYTLSRWESEAHLEAYRKSDFFKVAWPRLKSLFAEKAQAFSSAPVVLG